jgi:hypothetical protein
VILSQINSEKNVMSVVFIKSSHSKNKAKNKTNISLLPISTKQQHHDGSTPELDTSLQIKYIVCLKSEPDMSAGVENVEKQL